MNHNPAVFREVEGRLLRIKVDQEVGYRGIWRNQAWRWYEPLAHQGDGIDARALIEYEMPNGKAYLLEVEWDLVLGQPRQAIVEEGVRYKPINLVSGKSEPEYYEVVKRLTFCKNISRTRMPPHWATLLHETEALQNAAMGR